MFRLNIIQRANGERLFTHYIFYNSQNHIRLPYMVYCIHVNVKDQSVWNHFGLYDFLKRNQHINKIDKITIFHILASSTSFLAR